MNKELRMKNYELRMKVFIVAFSILYSIFFVSVAFAQTNTNIDENNRWAWNDIRGWIDFYSSGTVNATSTKLTGYAVFNDTAEDWISLDCATSPKGDICEDQSNYFVVNDGVGNLSGWAWNDGIGWISFNCSDMNICGTSNYKVTVDVETGDFEGWAWNDAIGWISFNCANDHGAGGICGTSSYKVRTSWVVTLAADGWLVSSTFDTGIEGGAGYNSIMWIGELGQAGNTVRFQLATSNCENGGETQEECDDTETSYWGTKPSGDGAFVGIDGTSESAYGPLPPGTPAPIQTHHVNKRYYRYKIFLDKAVGNEEPPVVNDVIVNWSR